MKDKKTVTVVTEVELSKHQFYCEKCKTIHNKSLYAIAQIASGVRLVFTCKCGNKIYL